MARIKAVELVAFGLQCDAVGCGEIVPTRNASSRPQGYYIQSLARISRDDAKSASRTPELYFCTKDCLVDAMKFGISSLTTIPFDPRVELFSENG